MAGVLSAQALPFEPVHESGASITGAFEGWFKNPDGTFTLLLGYYNRNTRQELEIPVGMSNRIEPGGPDRGQPTHFLTGRQWGMFSIQVPADFKDSKLTWTIVANGQTTVIPASLKLEWEISPLVEAAVGNTPPVVRFEENGATVQGPVGPSAQRSVKLGDTLPLTAWVYDDARITTPSGVRPSIPGLPVSLRWSKYRGPGEVTFSNPKPLAEKIPGNAPFNGKASTSVSFSAPGDYILHLLVNDYSGEGGNGYQCCWTTGQVRVSVMP
jgi:hypothetical protein